MPAIDYEASATPTDLVAGAGLVAGTLYAGQNTSTTATLFVRGALVTPAAGDRAFRVEAGSPFQVKDRGEPIWVWTDEPAGCPMILTRISQVTASPDA